MSAAAIRAILFDFDGTLAPNLDLASLRSEVVRFTAGTPVPQEVYADRYIIEIIDAAHNWLTANEPQAAEAYHNDAHQLIVNFEVAAARTTAPFPGVAQLLAELRNSNLKLGVVTRNCRAAVLEVFPDLLDYVDALHAREDVAHLKPDTRHLNTCLGQIGATADNSIMVGDGALDMRAGRALDMLCIGVLSGSNEAAALQAAGADHILPDALHLPDYLNQSA
ncbi:MAG: HAD family hydrolase [bacterium]